MMRLGRHMPTHSKLIKTAELAQQLGCTTIQIFASNPRSWRPTPSDTINLDAKELKGAPQAPLIVPTDSVAFAQAAHDCGLDPVVIHAPYLINLGSPDEFIWEKSVSLLRWTLQRGVSLGAKYVVFHTGSHRGSGVEAGIARIADGITHIFAEISSDVARGLEAAPMLLLENDVGGGDS